MFKKLLAAMLVIVASFCSISVFAQETTATIGGHITDEKGAFVSGAVITLKHEPTGTITTAQSNSKGIFYIPNLRVGVHIQLK